MAIATKLPIFSDLDEETLAKLDVFLVEDTFEAGTVIFTEGSDADAIYYLEAGMVEISIGTTGAKDEVVTDSVEKGNLFGWSAFIPPFKFTATARTLVDSKICVIDAGKLKCEMKQHPDLAWDVFEHLTKTLSSRLYGTRLRLTGFLIEGA